jgi:murein DD-endopeptidase MepM/ murein hydrolase activator NlpD
VPARAPFAGVRRALTIVTAAAIAVVLPTPRAFAATDSLAAAQAAITAAQQAADRAAAAYGEAEARYYQLQDDIAITRKLVATLQETRADLADVVHGRAVTVYMQGGSGDLDLLSASESALDAARRTTLASAANARAEGDIARLRAASEDLDLREATLQTQLADAETAMENIQAQQAELQRAVDEAVQAEQDLRTRLEQEQRAAEYASLVQQARDDARASQPTVDDGSSDNGSSDDGSFDDPGPGVIIGNGDWVCPIQGGVSFSDTWGAPRSGHTHQGVDMFAARGTPVVAVVSGSVLFQGDDSGGLAAYVTGSDGTTYYYAHLDDYVGGNRSVSAGELIGHVGNTGNAADAPPHVHFEIRPGGPNGGAINPTPTVAAHC